jgi:hypothetical protein
MGVEEVRCLPALCGRHDKRWRKRNKKVALKHGFEGARELILAWNG